MLRLSLARPRPTLPRPSRRSPAPAAAVAGPQNAGRPPTAGCGSSGSGGPSPTAARSLRVTPPDPAPPLVRVLALVPDAPSPVAGGTASWADVLAHEAVRLTWFESRLAVAVVAAPVAAAAAGPDPAATAAFDAAAAGVDVLLVVDAADGSPAAALAARAAAVGTVAALGPATGPAVAALARVAGAPVHPSTPLARVAAALPFTRTAAAARAAAVAAAMWSRGHSDDVLSAILVLVDAGVTRLASVDAFRGRGAATLLCMLRHCREATLACVTDPDCKAGLDCLSAVPPGDQVAAYRCIVSHESANFEAFSLCVLTRHRCLGVDAAIPSMPAPAPQATWRGSPLTHEAGLQIFVGWLAEGDPWSWRVVAGLSPAFDQFPNQVQLFYHGAARGSFWYDPVFQVDTLAGARVWRRRHYRVRPARGQPGVYLFSVLDNGVVSSEVWRIVDAPDDLSYALFCYVGAAAASGQAYVGAVLCTRDGGWVPAEHEARLAASLDRASIQPWELFRVRAEGEAVLATAPLGLDRRDAAADPVNGGGGRAVK